MALSSLPVVSHMSNCDWTLAILSEIALAEMTLSSPVMTPMYLEAVTVRTPTSGLSWRQLPSSTASDLARFVMPPVRVVKQGFLVNDDIF